MDGIRSRYVKLKTHPFAVNEWGDSEWEIFSFEATMWQTKGDGATRKILLKNL